MGVTNRQLLEISFLVLISITYLSLALHNIPYPGLRDDEAAEAYRAYQILKGNVTLNQYFMYSSYHGIIQVYSIIPFFFFFDANIKTLRFATIFYGLMSIILMFYLIKELFNVKMAFISVLILATLPSFIFYTRNGVLTNSFILVPLLGSMLFFTKGIKTNNLSYYCLGSIMFGLGFSIKITFWWLIIPLVLFFIWFHYLIKLNFIQITICIIFFIIGSAPIIIYNLISNFETFRFIFSHANPTQYLFLHNFAVRFTQFLHLLSGNLDGLPLGANYSAFVLPILFIISIIVVPIISIRNKRKNFAILLIIVSTLIILVESTFSFPTEGMILGINYVTWHIFILLPFGIAIVAYFIVVAFNTKNSKIFLIICMAFILFFNLKLTLKYHQIVKQSGGTEYVSSNMYDLYQYLMQNKILSPLYFDTHFNNNLLFLSHGIINGENICEFMNTNCGNELRDNLNKGILNKHQYYVISNPKWIFFPWVYTILNDYLLETNQTVGITKIFYDYEGEPIYYLLTLINESNLNSSMEEVQFPGSLLNSVSLIRTHPCEGCNVSINVKHQKEKIVMEVNYFIPFNRNHLYLFLHKVFEKIFSFDRDTGFVWIYRDYFFLNFTNYSSINLYVKSDDNQSSGLEFQIKEYDGDAWYYFDNTSLLKTNWTLIHMPFENFTKPSWAQNGDGKKTFDKIVRIGMTLTSFDKAINKTVYFKTFGDQLFFLT